MGFGNPFSKLEGAIKGGINSLGNDIRNGINGLGNSVKNGINSLGNQIEGKLKGVGNQIESGFKRAGNEIESGFKKVGNEIESGLKKAGHEIEDGFKKVGHEIESEIKGVGQEIKGGLQTAGQEIEAAFTEKLPELLEEAMKKVLAEVQKGALDKAVDILQLACPSKFALKVGPMEIVLEDMNDRIDTFQEWAKNPPTGKGDLKEMIEKLAPTEVSLELSFAVAFLVVETDSLEFGFTMTWSTEDFLDHLEDLIGKF